MAYTCIDKVKLTNNSVGKIVKMLVFAKNGDMLFKVQDDTGVHLNEVVSDVMSYVERNSDNFVTSLTGKHSITYQRIYVVPTVGLS